MTENLKTDNELIVEMIMNSILQIKGQNNHIQTNSPRLSNFAMGTILGKGFAQAKAQVHTNHSTSACGNPFPKIVPMVKLGI